MSTITNNRRTAASSRGRQPATNVRNAQVKKNSFDKTAVAEGVYGDDRFSHVVFTLVGMNVQVQVKNGCIYEGLFKTISPEMDVVLEIAHKVEDSSTNNTKSSLTRDRIIDYLVFKKDDVVSVTCLSVDLDYAVRDTFTDAAITRGNNGSQYDVELQPWDGEGGEELGLDEEGSANGWDANEMFKTNQEQFCVKSSYDENLSQYTTVLNKEDTKEYRKREEDARRLAREIERSEEYRKHIDLENGDDEEALFSSVHRNTSNTGEKKYLPPHARKNNTKNQGNGIDSYQQRPSHNKSRPGHHSQSSSPQQSVAPQPIPQSKQQPTQQHHHQQQHVSPVVSSPTSQKPVVILPADGSCNGNQDEKKNSNIKPDVVKSSDTSSTPLQSQSADSVDTKRTKGVMSPPSAKNSKSATDELKIFHNTFKLTEKKESEKRVVQQQQQQTHPQQSHAQQTHSQQTHAQQALPQQTQQTHPQQTHPHMHQSNTSANIEHDKKLEVEKEHGGKKTPESSDNSSSSPNNNNNKELTTDATDKSSGGKFVLNPLAKEFKPSPARVHPAQTPTPPRPQTQSPVVPQLSQIYMPVQAPRQYPSKKAVVSAYPQDFQPSAQHAQGQPLIAAAGQLTHQPNIPYIMSHQMIHYPAYSVMGQPNRMINPVMGPSHSAAGIGPNQGNSQTVFMPQTGPHQIQPHLSQQTAMQQTQQQHVGAHPGGTPTNQGVQMTQVTGHHPAPSPVQHVQGGQTSHPGPVPPTAGTPQSYPQISLPGQIHASHNPASPQTIHAASNPFPYTSHPSQFSFQQGQPTSVSHTIATQIPSMMMLPPPGNQVQHQQFPAHMAGPTQIPAPGHIMHHAGVQAPSHSQIHYVPHATLPPQGPSVMPYQQGQ